jgi:uncharacterized protein YcsI (UPF0317 family)
LKRLNLTLEVFSLFASAFAVPHATTLITQMLPSDFLVHNSRASPLHHSQRFRMTTTTPPQQDKNISPGALRLLAREGKFTGNTSGCSPGYVQANLVVLPREHAFDFMTFCVRNPKACPLLDVTDPGNPRPPAWLVKGDADLRTDLPNYRGTCKGWSFSGREEVYESKLNAFHRACTHEFPDDTATKKNYSRNKSVSALHNPAIHQSFPSHATTVWQDGELLYEVGDIRAFWRQDSVAFLLGCSFSFDEALLQAGLPVRHIQESKNVSMYKTTIPCRPAGYFQGNMVVSMRPFHPQQVNHVIQVTSRFKAVHGAPVHMGDPVAIGIADLSRPDYGEAVLVAEGEVPVFFACGVTPQNVILGSKPRGIVVTHAPGAMFVTDVLNEALTLS